MLKVVMVMVWKSLVWMWKQVTMIGRLESLIDIALLVINADYIVCKCPSSHMDD